MNRIFFDTRRRAAREIRLSRVGPEMFIKEHTAGTVCEAKVVGMTDFGAFASVIPGIDGLIHISQIADHRIDKPQDVLKVGDVVKVKITDVDLERHRVSLSIRAVLEDEQAAAAAEEAPADEVVFSTEDESSEE